MGKLVDGDDGLPAEVVGEWFEEKRQLLCDYVQISSATRKKYLPPPQYRGGATYIDLFCGPGRVFLKASERFEDGSCVGAWKQSQSSGAPFSKIIIGDNDRTRLDAAEARLKALGAPVQALYGTAAQNALPAIQKSTGNGLNFAFLDPYNLASLDFSILSTLAKLRRIDILVHVSQMDLQRNFDRNAVQDVSALDIFAPGWRTGANTERAQKSARQAYFQYWRDKVSGLGINAATDTRLVTGPGNQPLYLLLLAAKHDLAHRFWQTVAKKDDGQGSLRL